MSWPADQDYLDALQNPRTAFSDADLLAGTVECDRMGLPKPRAGNFAIVFKVNSGGRDWAVRCFKRDLSDRRDRYAAISSHLATVKLPSLSHFHFIERGVRVRGEWYPVLKMEWVAGDLLATWIEKHLSTPDRLRQIAAHWLETMGQLRKAGIGHGDLQHGNVVIENDQVRLIDYDSMYVPSLAGRLSPEVGHENYQHPLRAGHHYGPYIDDFSAWVIYVSLIALSFDKTLWSRFSRGQEAILFRRGDFADTGKSVLFGELLGSGDPRLRLLSESLRSLTGLPPEALPKLGENGLVPAGDLVLLCPQCSESLRVPSQTKASKVKCPRCRHEQQWSPSGSAAAIAPSPTEWWRTHEDATKGTQGLPSQSLVDLPVIEASLWSPAAKGDMSWLLESLSGSPKPNTKRFVTYLWLDRAVVFTAISAISAIVAATWTQVLTIAALSIIPAVLAIAILVLAIRYARHPLAAERRAHRRQESALRREMDQFSHRRREKSKEHEALKRAHARAIRQFADAAAKLDKRRDAQVKASTKPSEVHAKTLETRLAELDDSWRKDLAAILNQGSGPLAAARKKLSDCASDEAAVMADLGRKEQDEATAVRNRFDPHIADLSSKIQQSPAVEANALAVARSSHQQSFIQNAFQNELVLSASIFGVGDVLKARLRAAGISRASDVDRWAVTRVSGFGSTRVSAVMDWRNAVGHRAQARAPALPRAEEDRIKQDHHQQRLGWQAQTSRLQMAYQQEKDSVRRKFEGARAAQQSVFATRRQQAQTELTRLEHERAAKERAVNDRYSGQQASLQSQIANAKRSIVDARVRALAASQPEVDQLEADRKRAEADMLQQSKTIEDSLSRIRVDEAASAWKRARLDFEATAFHRITLRHYVRRVVGAN